MDQPLMRPVAAALLGLGVALPARALPAPALDDPTARATSSSLAPELHPLAAGLQPHLRPFGTDEDLDPLLALIGERRAVLLGEASHGTEEFYTWRARISQRLVTEQGFRFIAVEGDWGSSVAVNRYVKDLEGAPASARAALASFTRWPTWLWSNQAVLELVEWLRAHNDGLPPEERVGFYGIDVYGLEDSLLEAPRHLRGLDEDFADEVERAYGCLRQHAGDIQRYLQRVARGGSCSAAVTGVVARLREQRDDWSTADGEAYFHAKQNALVVQSAERHYRAMLARDHTSWNARARHFHRTFERLLERYGAASRGIVWAHNTHIGDARATPMVGQRMVNIGQLTRDSLGRDEVALVGFGTRSGEVVAGSSWGAPAQVMEVPPAAEGSLEDSLFQASAEPSLLILDDAREVSGIEEPIVHRAIGVSYDPGQEQGNYVPTVLAERYDAFLFIPVTTALRELAGDVEDE